MITHTSDSHQNTSRKKTKLKLQILKIAKNSNKTFAINITRDTPSEVAW